MALVVFAALIGLGLWQLRRMAQTSEHRARLAALAQAPPRPLDEALAGARSTENLDHTRVSVRCAPPPAPSPAIYRYSVVDGVIGWRLLDMCRLSGATWGALAIDRGRIGALTGAMTPRALSFSAPRALVGVVRSLGGAPLFGDDMPADRPGTHLLRVLDPPAIAAMARWTAARAPMPYYLVVESEAPAPAGVSPAPVVEDVPRDNFGYALTWFGLAAGLACVYAAMVWRRLTAR